MGIHLWSPAFVDKSAMRTSALEGMSYFLESIYSGATLIVEKNDSFRTAVELIEK